MPVSEREKVERDEIIAIGKKLYGLRLVAARAGNVSVRLDESTILITASGASLGSLTNDDIVKVDLTKESQHENKRLSTEFPLHSTIYKHCPIKVIIHCHPPLINGYFSVYSDLKPLTFETKLFLGNVPVVEQETPTVTKPELVVEALKTNNLVVIKHHGVVSVGENFVEALYLIETLEEAVKVAGIARLFKKEVLDDLDRELKGELTKEDGIYPMFSREHIQAIVDLVNQDEFIGKKGRELNLTVKLAIQLDGSGLVYKFTFEKGRITELSFDDDAPFVISAPRDIWELIFLGKLDPFVAVNQRKMQLKGDLLRLSCWYTPFMRLFELFKQVRIK
jgi:ribulose-5-phosphate 4-epimerase/fuculose-1-phosphate aldolase